MTRLIFYCNISVVLTYFTKKYEAVQNVYEVQNEIYCLVIKILPEGLIFLIVKNGILQV